MPDINEFFNTTDKKMDLVNTQTINSPKPCSKCEENSTTYTWNKDTFTMTWKCKNGHPNELKVNS